MAAPDQFEFIGPSEIYVGDFATPTVTKLAGVRTVSIDFGLGMAYSTKDAQRDLPHVDGIYVLPAAPRVQIGTTDLGHDNLKALILGLVQFTEAGPPAVEAVGLPDEFEKVDAADVPGMFILPLSQKADGAAAVNGIWLPGIIPTAFNGIQSGRVQRGQEVENPYSIEVMACYRDTDWAAAAIPAGARILFDGDPSAAGLAWSLN